MAESIERHHDRSETLRIAIVGTGIAGCSAASFLRAGLGATATIVAFEQSTEIGGRIQRRDFAGASVETGATLIHSSNAYMARFIDDLGLRRTSPHNREASGPATTAIWDGDAFVWRSHPREAVSTLRLLARYGRAPLRARSLTQAMLARWTRIYEQQAQARSYATPRALFEALDLYAVTQQTSYDFFARHRLPSRFVREFLDGVSRINYGQDGSIHAFVNLISLTGAGLAGGSLFSVSDGNAQVCRGLLAKSGAEVRTGTRVATIAATPGAAPDRPRYRIASGHDTEETYDAVVLAAPLERARIQLTGIAGWSPAPVERRYQVTHATLVAGTLDPRYFGRTSSLPQTILTTEEPRVPFSSIGLVGHSPALGVSIYKVFSRDALDDALLGRVFARPEEVLRIVWRAYPVLTPSPHWEPFRLQHGLYYVNAMESAVSTMETEAVASRNVAQLLIEDTAALR